MANIFKSLWNGAADSIKSPLQVGKDLIHGDFSGALKDVGHMPGNQERANSQIFNDLGIRGWVGDHPGEAVGAAAAAVYGGAAAAGMGAGASTGTASAAGSAEGASTGASSIFSNPFVKMGVNALQSGGQQQQQQQPQEYNGFVDHIKSVVQPVQPVTVAPVAQRQDHLGTMANQLQGIANGRTY